MGAEDSGTGLVGIEELVKELRGRDDARAEREKAIVLLLKAQLEAAQNTALLLDEIKTAAAQQAKSTAAAVAALQKTIEDAAGEEGS